MNGITASTAPWYASRATGVVSLLLLTAVMVLGILVNRQGRLPGLPRFAVTNLHRNLSLLAVVFLVIHIVTAVMDTFGASRGLRGVPFTSGYEAFWLGLGAVSLDIMLALIVTSLVRGRLNRKVWRAVHWLACAGWPIAFAHSIGPARTFGTGPCSSSPSPARAASRARAGLAHRRRRPRSATGPSGSAPCGGPSQAGWLPGGRASRPPLR